jgi:hypothetical protein
MRNPTEKLNLRVVAATRIATQMKPSFGRWVPLEMCGLLGDGVDAGNESFYAKDDGDDENDDDDDDNDDDDSLVEQSIHDSEPDGQASSYTEGDQSGRAMRY